MTQPGGIPRRSWPAVLIFIVGAVALVFTLVHALTMYNALGQVANVFILLFGYFPGVVAVLVAAFVLAFGSGSITSLVGSSRWGRLMLVAWALLNAASQIAFIGYLTDDAANFAHAQDVQVTISIAATLAGIAAAVFVFRAQIATGYGRVSLFVAALLFAATEGLLIADPTDGDSYWSLPRLLGLVLLGLSWWRAGLRQPLPVPEQPKSLAE